MTPRRIFSLLLLGVLVAFSAGADTLVFTNGDRLTGTKLGEDNGYIHFDAANIGPIAVLASSARVEVPPPAPPAAPAPKRSARRIQDFSPLDFRTAARDPERARAVKEVEWMRKLEFGFSAHRNGSDRTDLALRFEMARRGLTSEARLQVRHLYGETDDVRSVDNTSANLRLRKNLSGVLFGQSVTRFDRDGLKGIDYEVEQGIGVGRNLVHREDFVLAIGAGSAARRRDVVGTDANWAVLVDGFQDFTYEINDRLTLTQDFSMVLAPARSDDYKLRLNAALNTQLTDALQMSMRYEFEYNRAVVPLERESQRVLTSIGLVF